MAKPLQSVGTELGRAVTLLPAGDDLELIVLKGHLLLEEQVGHLLAEGALRPDRLAQVKLSFWERVQLYQAFVDSPAEPEFWKLILQLNTLRNDMAHDLEPSDFRMGVVEFAAAVETYSGFPPEDFDDAQRLRTCIVHLLQAMVDLRDA